MQLTAVDSNPEQGIPPFTCAARRFDGNTEIFPGYYDSVEGRVIECEDNNFVSHIARLHRLSYVVNIASSNITAPYANSLGRTDIENCCWYVSGP